MQVKLTLDSEAALARLRGIENRAKELQPVLEAIADDFHAAELARFAGADSRWEPLSHAQALWKSLHGEPTTPLAGGPLERSLTGSGRRFSITRRGTTAITLGTSDPVANLHNTGTGPRTQPTKRGRKRYVGRLPQRRPIIITKEMREQFTERYRAHLRGDGEQ